MLIKNVGVRMVAPLAVFALSGCMSLMPLMAPSVVTEKGISAEFPFESRYVTVDGSKIHYVEVGAGTPVVFIHGNPTSSYLWRNVLPLVGKGHRAIAVDLIGMGKSDKPDLDYTLDAQLHYFDGFMEALNLEPCTLVVHDWGGPIGFDYAKHHPGRVTGIVMMETLIRPMKWSEAGFPIGYMFRKFRDPEEGQALIVKENYFVEQVLPMMAGRKMSEAEMEQYRAPFLREADRKVILNWPRAVPIDGEPRRSEEIVQGNYEFLQRSTIPLLLLRGSPGALMSDTLVAELKRALPRMAVRDIGPAMHYVQEAQPTNVGVAVNEWLAR